MQATAPDRDGDPLTPAQRRYRQRDKRDMISVLRKQVKAKNMQIPYEFAEKIKINQHQKPALAAQVDAHRAVLLLLPEGADETAWKPLPYADLLEARFRRLQQRERKTSRLITDLPNDNATHVEYLLPLWVILMFHIVSVPSVYTYK